MPRCRHSTAAAARLLPVLAAGFLGGCASLGIPLGREDLGVDPVVTGSIVPASSGPMVEGVDPSDWEAVRQAIAGHGTTAPLAWSNPDTGSSGTLAALLPVEAGDGRLCRDFSTTLSDHRGVRRYHGAACEAGEGDWRLLRIVPEDTTLS